MKRAAPDIITMKVHPIKRTPLGPIVTSPGSEDFWTLYGITEKQESFAIGDFNTQEAAETCKTSIQNQNKTLTV